MEAPHHTEVETSGMMPPPVPAAGVPAAPRDSPAPAPPAARARFATVLALVVGVVTGWVVSTALGAPHLRLEALDTLVTKVRTFIGAPHPAETTHAMESPPPAAPLPAAPVPALEATVVTVDDAEA